MKYKVGDKVKFRHNINIIDMINFHYQTYLSSRYPDINTYNLYNKIRFCIGKVIDTKEFLFEKGHIIYNVRYSEGIFNFFEDELEKVFDYKQKIKFIKELL